MGIVKSPQENRFHLLMGHNMRLFRVHSYTKCLGLSFYQFCLSKMRLQIRICVRYYPISYRFWFQVLNNHAICQGIQFLHGIHPVFLMRFFWCHHSSRLNFQCAFYMHVADFLPNFPYAVLHLLGNIYLHTGDRFLRRVSHPANWLHVSNVVLVFPVLPLCGYRNQMIYQKPYRPVQNPLWL